MSFFIKPTKIYGFIGVLNRVNHVRDNKFSQNELANRIDEIGGPDAFGFDVGTLRFLHDHYTELDTDNNGLDTFEALGGLVRKYTNNILSPGVDAHFAKQFFDLDINHNGVIDPEEYSAGNGNSITDQDVFNGSYRTFIFEELDLDHNGFVDPAELIASKHNYAVTTIS